MSDMGKKETGTVYTNLGNNKFSYWNEDGGFFLANEFGQKHESANLVGRFECYWYPERTQFEKGSGFWRSEKTGLGKTGPRVQFKQNDTIDLVFQGEVNCTVIPVVLTLTFAKCIKITRIRLCI